MLTGQLAVSLELGNERDSLHVKKPVSTFHGVNLHTGVSCDTLRTVVLNPWSIDGCRDRKIGKYWFITVTIIAARCWPAGVERLKTSLRVCLFSLAIPGH